MANDEIEDQGDGGSTTEEASLSSINFSEFLTDSSSLDGVDFQAASGINASRVASAAIGAVAFAVTWALTSLGEALIAVPVRLIDWVTGFWQDLVQSTVGVGISAVVGVWSFTLAEFGLGAYPAALVVILATFYVVDKGIDTAQEVLR